MERKYGLVWKIRNEKAYEQQLELDTFTFRQDQTTINQVTFGKYDVLLDGCYGLERGKETHLNILR